MTMMIIPIRKSLSQERKLCAKEHHTHREPLCQYLFALPSRLAGHLEELHVALGKVGPMVGVKHEHTPAEHDGALTGREQRAMLFAQNPRIKTHPRYPRLYFHPFRDTRCGDWAKGGDDCDGSAPEND